MKKVFLDYVEGHVNFIPTYKYDPGTDNWDTRLVFSNGFLSLVVDVSELC